MMVSKAKLKTIIKIIVIVLVLGYVGKQLAEIEWSQLRDNWRSFEPVYLGFAFVTFFVGLFYLGLGWHIILWRMGGSLPYRRGIYIWIASQLGRFVPGKVVLVLGRAYMCEKEGIKKRVTSASVMYEMAFLTLAAFILFFVSSTLIEPDMQTEGGKILDFVGRSWWLVLVGVAAIHPKIFYTIINTLLRMIGKDPLSEDLRFTDSLMILAYYIGFWVVVGFGFFWVIKSFDHSVSMTDVIIYGGIYASSCTLGFLMIFVPDGIGVREGAIKNLLLATGLVAAEDYPFVIGVMVRVVSLAPEIVGFLIVRAMTDISRYKGAPTAEEPEPMETNR